MKPESTPGENPENSKIGRRTFFQELPEHALSTLAIIKAFQFGWKRAEKKRQEERKKNLASHKGKESWDPDAIESLILKISNDLKIKPDVLRIALLELLRKPVGDTVSVIAEDGTKYILQLDNRGTIHCSMFKTPHSKERI